MSVSDERAGKMGWIEIAGAATQGPFVGTSSVRSFRQWPWMQMMAQSWVMSGSQQAFCLARELRCRLTALILAPVAGYC